MNDLKALAAQKAAANQVYSDFPEDSPELKTPTAEDMMIPEQKVIHQYSVLTFKKPNRYFKIQVCISKLKRYSFYRAKIINSLPFIVIHCLAIFKPNTLLEMYFCIF